MKKVLTALLIGLLVISCEKGKSIVEKRDDGVVVYKNRATPSNPNFSYQLTEDTTISFAVDDHQDRNFEAPGSIVTDEDGNIYIPGLNTAKIFKFSSDYKFISSFGGKGKGPGEFSGGPSSLTYHNGQILAPCWRTTNTNVYNVNGEFVKLIPPTVSAGFSGQKSFGEHLLMNVEYRESKDSEVVVRTAIALMKPSYESVDKTIYSHDTETSSRCLRISEMYVRYATTKDILYVGNISNTDYTIYGYDKQFKKVMEIRKDYKMEKELSDKASVYMFGKSLGGGFYGKKDTPFKKRDLYYKSINHIYTDSNSRLWVVSPTKNKKSESGLYLDIFEEGVYLNTIHLPFYKSRDFSFIYANLFMSGDKLFYIDSEDEVIRVFKYETVGV
jgi:hypothetical protein